MQKPRIYFDAKGGAFPWMCELPGATRAINYGKHEHALSRALAWCHHQLYDWCHTCDGYTRWYGEFCGGCGREWGNGESEYLEKRDQLAKFLCDLAYAPGKWDIADAGMRKNYTLDAEEIIAANPHLLSLPVRLAVLEGKSLEDDERENSK